MWSNDERGEGEWGWSGCDSLAASSSSESSKAASSSGFVSGSEREGMGAYRAGMVVVVEDDEAAPHLHCHLQNKANTLKFRPSLEILVG